MIDNNNDDLMSSLIQKIDNQMENVKKSILNLPSTDFDLDLNFDMDFSPEIKLKPPKEKKDIINIENKVDNKVENKKEEEILKNKKEEENLEINKKVDSIDNNNNKNNEENNELNKSNEEEEDKTISADNMDENIDINNEQNEEEKEENKKSKSEGEWDLINSSKNKEEEKDNNINTNIINNNYNDKDSKIEENNKKENESINSNIDIEEIDINNNNDKIRNNEAQNEIEKNSEKNEINKKNSDSIYESIDEIGDEFEEGNNQNKNDNNNNINNNIPNNINNEKTDTKKEESKSNQSINDPNDDINNKESLNNIKNNGSIKSHSIEVQEEEKEISSHNINPGGKNEENNINNLNNLNINNEVEVNNNKNEEEKKEKKDQKEKSDNNSSDLEISEKQETASRKSKKSKISTEAQNQNINIQQVPPALEIQQLSTADVNEEKKEKNKDKLKSKKLGELSSSEDKKKFKEILNKIKEFRKDKIDENKIKLEKYPVINLDFNYQEETLDDLIPSLSKKIEENEPSKEVEKRKLNFMAHNYFEGIISTSNLLQLVPECQISHIESMQKIHKEKGLKNLPKITEEENYSKKIFGEKDENLIKSNKIGDVDCLENFLYKYHLENNEEISSKSYKYFPYWRSVESDGNSFYRAAMFAVIENFIVKNLREQLNQIISEITCDRFIQIYKDKEIDYKIPFYILSTILFLLENNKIEEAYFLFIKSYWLKDNSFDNMLIIYLRYICFDYVKEILELCKDEEILKKCDTKITKDDININKELIKTMNVEPDFFIICLMPYLFDINIIIFYLDRDLTKPKEGLVKLIDEEYPDLPFISLGYFFSSYHRIYWREWINEEPVIKKIFCNEDYEMKKLIHELKSNKKCKNCKNNEFVVFLEKKIMVCKNCLNDYINELSIKRKEALLKDNYIGKEYYSRAMKLNEEKNLDDFEFIELKEDYNMINYLQQKLSVQCSKCQNFFTKKNLNNLKCKCLLCDKCLNDIIIKITDGKKILNIYEKNILNKMKCSICGYSFSYEDAIDHLKDIKQSDKNNAIKRMGEYASTLCLICAEKVREKNDNVSISNNNEEKNEEEKEKEKYNEIKKYKIIKLKKEGERNKGIDYIDCEHVICFECFEKNKVNNILHVSNSSDDEQDESIKYFIDVTNGTCFCRLCNKKHFLLDKSSKDSACCKTALCSLI